MKKIILFSVLSFLFLFSSCKKELDTIVPVADNKVTLPYYKVLTKDFTAIQGTWNVKNVSGAPVSPSVWVMTFNNDGTAVSTNGTTIKVWDAYQVINPTTGNYFSTIYLAFGEKRVNRSGVMLPEARIYAMSEIKNGKVDLFFVDPSGRALELTKK